MATQTVPAPARHLLSVHDFHRMGEAGILAGDDRTDLIDGGLRVAPALLPDLSIPLADFWS